MEVSEGEYSSIYDIKKELHDELLLAENCENGDDGINARVRKIAMGRWCTSSIMRCHWLSASRGPITLHD